MPVPSADFPCPHCLLDILLDEDTAGREVSCPHCEVRVLLPKLPPAALPVVELKPIHSKRKAPAPPPADFPQQLDLSMLGQAPAGEMSADLAQKNFPLHKSQPILELRNLELHPEANLPQKGRSREEELRRLAAMAGSAEYDLGKFQRKGMLTFACPRCARPLWVSKKESGVQVSCEGCSAAVISPRPELGLPAQLLEDDGADVRPALPKAVLPTTRQVEDISLNEGLAGGRARRQPPNPKPPAAPSLDQPHKPLRHDHKIQPVPARGDEILTGASILLPSERKSTARTVGAQQRVEPAEPAAVAPAPEPTTALAEPADPKASKGAGRLNNKGRTFSPHKEVESDLEVLEAWGQTEAKPPVSRRYLVIATLTMIPILFGVAIWTIKGTFAKHPPAAAKPAAAINEADKVRVAQSVLDKFFEAKTVEEMARYVRHPEITLPRMQAWYQRPFARFAVESLSNPQESEIDGVDFLVGNATFTDGKSRPVALEIPDARSPNASPDDLRLDWESFVYWSEVSWDKFQALESERACEFRVVLQRDSYPTPPYDDEARWICFKINYPGTVQEQFGYCFGYIELGSDVATEMVQPMRRIAENGLETLNATVKLRFRGDARGRKNFVPQVTIEHFTDGWLRPHEP